MGPRSVLGGRIRVLRQRVGLTQAALAKRLGISASYLNLIEHNRRNLSAPLLLKVARTLDVDLQSFDAAGDARLLAELSEAVGDPLFEGKELEAELREMVGVAPGACRAFVQLYQAYRDVRGSAASLAARLSEDLSLPGVDRSRQPNDEVSGFIQEHLNHFPELEEAADRLRHDAQLRREDLLGGMIRHLEGQLGVKTEFVRVEEDRGAVRRYEPGQRLLLLSESLPPSSRSFQVAHQLGLLTEEQLLENIASIDPRLTTDGSRALGRVILANYFAGAVLMPYEPFLAAAHEQRHDVELLQNRFGANVEMVCHRLTTLQRPGAAGVPFHFVRVDIAGNISKWFSASGFPIPRHGGSCPRWNVHAAFLTPDQINVQLSRTVDGETWFSIARTISRVARGYHVPRSVQAITLGCHADRAAELVYADRVDPQRVEAAVPVGTTCRLCQQPDCDQRVLPPIQQPLHVHEHVRGHSFYNPFRD